jgi:hypothetical protein
LGTTKICVSRNVEMRAKAARSLSLLPQRSNRRVAKTKIGLALSLASLLAIGMPGCGGSSGSGTGPSQMNLGGNYAGVAQDSVAGAGNFNATLSQTGGTVTGTWHIAFPSHGFHNAGQVNGSMGGTSLVAILTPSDPRTCPFNLTATLSGNQLSGTYASFDCTGVIAGTFQATRP